MTVERKRLIATFYIAQAIEHKGKDADRTMDWKNPFKELTTNPLVGCYDPVDRETQKSGQPCGSTGQYINGLKCGGHWEQFDRVLDKIWWGDLTPDENKMRALLALRDKFIIDGNSVDDLNYWGDYEAVVRSTFIFVYLEKKVKTVGTICELETAYLLGIPIYLIIPDEKIRDANSSLIYRVRKSGGKAFYSSQEAVKYVKEYYKL